MCNSDRSVARGPCPYKIEIRHRNLSKKKKSIIEPGRCLDFMCLPKCIVLGQLLADNNVNAINRLLYNKNLLDIEVQALVKDAKVEVITGEGCNILDIYKFQKCTPDYSIFVYNNKTAANSVYCHSKSASERINIFHFNELKHFVVLKSRKAFFGLQKECCVCDLVYSVHALQSINVNLDVQGVVVRHCV